jgi:hypothetical protein
MPLQSSDSHMDIKYLKLDPPVLYLPVGESWQVKVYAVLTNGRQVEVSTQADWSMRPTNVGEVTQAGLVTASCPGNSMIVARYGPHRAEGILVAIGEESSSKPKRRCGKGFFLGSAAAIAALLLGGAVFGQIFTQPADRAQQLQTAAAISISEPPPAEKVPAHPESQLAASSPQVLVTESAPAGTAEPATTHPKPEKPEEDTAQPEKSVIQQAIPFDHTAAPSPVKPVLWKDVAAKRSESQSKATPSEKKKTSFTVEARPKPLAPPQLAPPKEKDPEPAERNGKWGYIKRTSVFEQELVIPYQFDHATSFSDGLALVKKDGKFGYINKQGELVIPFLFDYATPFTKGVATVKKDGQLGRIDKSGTLID